MPKVYLICGKICSGKTTHAAYLCKTHQAVLLSTDEITLALFDQHIGEKHDEYVERTQRYLLEKSLELIQTGISVVLDWGFWMKEEREETAAYFRSHNIDFEWHYIDIQDSTWRKRIQKRNQAILDGKACAYFVDDALSRKFDAIFEPPSFQEMDVWIQA